YTGGPTLNKSMIVHNSHLEKIKVLLPDQSEIWLNQQSEISYDSDFGISHRILSLQGEAFFDIQKSEIPFVINTNQTKTEVLGTAFNLRSFAEETELTLIRGSVAFSEKDNPSNKVILIPGERAIHQVGSDQILKSENSDANFIAWKEEVLVFDKTELDEVITALEKYFDIKVEVNNLQLYNCRFTGRFYNPNLDIILEVLSASLNIKYTLKDNNVSLTGAGCPSN
ncbi:FecR domain-containing protein, partial [Reichenbachiella sp.]